MAVTSNTDNELNQLAQAYAQQTYGSSIQLSNQQMGQALAEKLLGWDSMTTDFANYTLNTIGTAGSTMISPWAYAQPSVPNPIKLIKFFRINQPVEMPEGSALTEKLDEIRIKVAKWLK